MICGLIGSFGGGILGCVGRTREGEGPMRRSDLLARHSLPQRKRQGQRGLNSNLILHSLALLPALLLDLLVLPGPVRSRGRLL